MSFWRITLKRSLNLSKTYVVLGLVIAVYGIGLSNLLSAIELNPSDIGNVPVNLSGVFPILSVAFLSLSALLFSTGVVMLFVYDKGNGVFEYLLSTGLDQLDIFKGYVKAALVLASYLLVFSIVLNTVVGLLLETSLMLLAGVAVLTFSLGISTVFLVTVCMIAFSSLQKTPTGANQPLGVIVGIVPVFPALILPFVFPSYALAVDISIAAVTSLASVGLLLSIGKLIMREKLLP